MTYRSGRSRPLPSCRPPPARQPSPQADPRRGGSGVISAPRSRHTASLIGPGGAYLVVGARPGCRCVPGSAGACMSTRSADRPASRLALRLGALSLCGLVEPVQLGDLLFVFLFLLVSLSSRLIVELPQLRFLCFIFGQLRGKRSTSHIITFNCPEIEGAEGHETGCRAHFGLFETWGAHNGRFSRAEARLLDCQKSASFRGLGDG